MDLRVFKAAVSAKKRGAPPTSFPKLRKFDTRKSVAAGDRVIKFTISTPAIDLDNDKVDQAGWDLSVYRTNPIVLWNHDPGQFPVGKCASIGLEKGNLVATVAFVPAAVPIAGEMAEAIYQMCRAGFLSATSVGFVPLDYDIASDRTAEDDYLPGVNFKRQKLLEFSICGIPANSEALIDPSERDPAAGPHTPAQRSTLSTAEKDALRRRFERAKLLARIL